MAATPAGNRVMSRVTLLHITTNSGENLSMNLRHTETNPVVHGRRSALRSVAMGLAALGALPMRAHDAEAKKRCKKRKKPASQSQDRCLPQVAECEAVATKFCEGVSEKALCLEALSACCQPLGTCHAGQSIQCVIGAFTQKV